MYITWREFLELTDEIEYKDWALIPSHAGAYYTLQWTFVENDEVQYCRIWLVDPYQPKSDIVRTAIFAVITAEEHEARERFRYKGKKIFNPHFDADRLAEISGKLENLDIPDVAPYSNRQRDESQTLVSASSNLAGATNFYAGDGEDYRIREGDDEREIRGY